MSRIESAPARRGRLAILIGSLTAVAVVAAIAAVVLFTGGDDSKGSDASDLRARLGSAQSAASPDSAGSPRGGFVPTRIEIPAIGVNAVVESLGTAGDGSQQVPQSIDTTAWWKYGSRPGAAGSAAITGHTASQGDGVFDDLGKLKRGQKIRVEGAKKSQVFVVQAVRTIPRKDFAKYAPSIYSKVGPSRIAVTTCGDFNGKDYDSTIAVWATALDSGGN